MKFNFIKPTLIFCIIGFIIPGFTAILLFGIQILLSEIGLDCSDSWELIWLITSIGMVILPTLFIYNLKYKSNENHQKLKIKLFFFNLFEYIFIQSTFVSFFTNGDILCNVSDGQNGLELVFTAWLALPILLVFSYIFKRISKSL